MSSNRSVLTILLLMAVAGCAGVGDPGESARVATEAAGSPQAESKTPAPGTGAAPAGTGGDSGKIAAGTPASPAAGAAAPKAAPQSVPSPAPAGAATQQKAAAPKAAPAPAPAAASPAATKAAPASEPAAKPPVAPAAPATAEASLPAQSLDGDPTAGELDRLAERSKEVPEANGDAAEGEGTQPERRESDYADRSLQCDVVLLMGREIGRRRRDGDERKTATNKAIDDVVRATGSERDKRFVFSGRVYGMLIYQLKQDHTPDGFGAYAHAACLILRGRKGIVPADEASEALLDQAVSNCESRSRGQDDLNACIAERVEQIVLERGRRS